MSASGHRARRGTRSKMILVSYSADVSVWTRASSFANCKGYEGLNDKFNSGRRKTSPLRGTRARKFRARGLARPGELPG